MQVISLCPLQFSGYYRKGFQAKYRHTAISSRGNVSVEIAQNCGWEGLGCHPDSARISLCDFKQILQPLWALLFLLYRWEHILVLTILQGFIRVKWYKAYRCFVKLDKLFTYKRLFFFQRLILCSKEKDWREPLNLAWRENRRRGERMGASMVWKSQINESGKKGVEGLCLLTHPGFHTMPGEVNYSLPKAK